MNKQEEMKTFADERNQLRGRTLFFERLRRSPRTVADFYEPINEKMRTPESIPSVSRRYTQQGSLLADWFQRERMNLDNLHAKSSNQRLFLNQ